MIITEYYLTRKDGVRLYRTYSDGRLMIHKLGTDELYSEAVDIEGADYQYEETNEPIEEMPEEFA